MSVMSTGEIRDEAARRGYNDLVAWIDARINERVKARAEYTVNGTTITRGHHYDVAMRQPLYVPRTLADHRTTIRTRYNEDGSRYTIQQLRDWVYMGRTGWSDHVLSFRKDNGTSYGRMRDIDPKDIESISETDCKPTG